MLVRSLLPIDDLAMHNAILLPLHVYLPVEHTQSVANAVRCISH